MKWNKQGLIYVTNSTHPWAVSHAMVPTPVMTVDNTLRIYLGFLDGSGIGRVGYVDVDPNDLSKVLNVSERPVLDIGEPGTFDDRGVLPSSVVDLPDGTKYMYYIGFERSETVRYRIFSGLAVSIDDGHTFKRLKKTPVLERSDKELYFRGGPFVIYENNKFKVWYNAGSEWIDLNGKKQPVYNIRYLESSDGISWGDEGEVCISVEKDNEYGFGRPYVVKENDIYKMYYSIRNKYLGYRLGYATSVDGFNWERNDSSLNLDVSYSGWDSTSISYGALFNYLGRKVMFYNGNEFGKTGIGYATLI